MEKHPTIGKEYSTPMSWKKKKQAANELVSEYQVETNEKINKTFITFTAVPGAGKSTISKHLSEKYHFNSVATDSIKTYLQNKGEKFVIQDLFHIQAIVFKYLLAKSANIVSDSNSDLSVHRYKLKKMADKYGYKTYHLYLTCDPEICIERVLKRNHVKSEELIEKWKKKIYLQKARIQVPRNAITINTDTNLKTLFFKINEVVESRFQ